MGYSFCSEIGTHVTTDEGYLKTGSCGIGEYRTRSGMEFDFTRRHGFTAGALTAVCESGVNLRSLELEEGHHPLMAEFAAGVTGEHHAVLVIET